MTAARASIDQSDVSIHMSKILIYRACSHRNAHTKSRVETAARWQCHVPVSRFPLWPCLGKCGILVNEHQSLRLARATCAWRRFVAFWTGTHFPSGGYTYNKWVQPTCSNIRIQRVSCGKHDIRVHFLRAPQMISRRRLLQLSILTLQGARQRLLECAN